jgi:hypothetical protein
MPAAIPSLAVVAGALIALLYLEAGLYWFCHKVVRPAIQRRRRALP